MSRPDVYLLTGPTRSGKTTALQNWIQSKSVAGILTPVVEGERRVMNIVTGLSFDMETGEDDAIRIGRHAFSKLAFEQMNELIIATAATRYDWVVIDEVGPLELNKQGLYPSVRFLLEHSTNPLLWVVREPLVEEVVTFFRLTNPKRLTRHQLE